ncbi:glucokinase [Purpureocillium lilacinum]|uniref:Phosphotransferase n=1 Tax=Purpureocillium lilacinum TaxID=33203 RepID=A0A179EZD0_PURLI|nr:glucokinase [Purpureocillium lilacinum]OAQ58554.1 glucokinase [Purpureocillium lilacinum]
MTTSKPSPDTGLLAEARRIAQQFDLKPDDVARAADHSTEHSLEHNGATQLPSFVTKVPNGSERGMFLTVDLGGTHCRVCLVDLHGDSTYTLIQTKHVIPRALKVNPSYKPLFGFVADKIADFLSQHPEADAESVKGEAVKRDDYRRLGFIFSFTYESHSLSSGTTLQWDKGWDIADALGRDPCEMLQTAIDDLELPVLVCAMTSDSVGTFMARAYTSPRSSATLVGAVFGTGTNAAYVECLENVRVLHAQNEFRNRRSGNVMIMNTEWGAWLDDDNTVVPTTTYDVQLDTASTNPNRQILEKLTSGMYLGELARLAMLQLYQAKQFDMVVQDGSPLCTVEAVDSSLLSLIAADGDESLTQSRRHISEALEAQGVSVSDATAVRLNAAAIVRRAARLAGAATAAIILQSGRLEYVDHTDKGMDSVYREREGTESKSSWSWTRNSVWSLVRRAVNYIFRCFTGRDPYAASVSEHGHQQVVGWANIDIGIEGSLVEHHPAFEKEMRWALQRVPKIGPDGERRITIGLAKDGSSLGAALVAYPSMDCTPFHVWKTTLITRFGLFESLVMPFGLSR